MIAEDGEYKDTQKCEEQVGKTYGSDRAVQKESSNSHHEGGCKAGNCIPKDIPKQIMTEKWNLMIPQGRAWNLLYLPNTKIALRAKVSHR